MLIHQGAQTCPLGQRRKRGNAHTVLVLAGAGS